MKRKALLLLILCGILFSSYFTTQVKADQFWSHNANQVPYPGCQFTVMAWFVTGLDYYGLPIKVNLVLDMTYSAFSIPNESLLVDIMMTGDVQGHYLMIENLVTRNCTSIINITGLLENFPIQVGYAPMEWILNNVTIGDNVTFGLGKVFIIDTIEIRLITDFQFNCFRAVVGASNGLFSFAECFFDIRTGVMVQIKSYDDRFGIAIQTAEFIFAGGNIPGIAGGLTTQDIIIMAGVGIGILGVILALGYRTRITGYIRGRGKSEKKDHRKKKGQKSLHKKP